MPRNDKQPKDTFATDSTAVTSTDDQVINWDDKDTQPHAHPVNTAPDTGAPPPDVTTPDNTPTVPGATPEAPAPFDPDPNREATLEHKLAPGAIAAKGPRRKVVAIADFGDARTQRQFKAGDEVPWDEERAKRFPHLVEIV
jgi:hypothetical protein